MLGSKSDTTVGQWLTVQERGNGLIESLLIERVADEMKTGTLMDDTTGALKRFLDSLHFPKERKMASEITIKGKRAPRGEKMTKGKGWRLATVTGRKRVFVGTLLHTINMGSKRIAIFSVPK